MEIHITAVKFPRVAQLKFYGVANCLAFSEYCIYKRNSLPTCLFRMNPRLPVCHCLVIQSTPPVTKTQSKRSLSLNFSSRLMFTSSVLRVSTHSAGGFILSWQRDVVRSARWMIPTEFFTQEIRLRFEKYYCNVWYYYLLI